MDDQSKVTPYSPNVTQSNVDLDSHLEPVLLAKTLGSLSKSLRTGAAGLPSWGAVGQNSNPQPNPQKMMTCNDLRVFRQSPRVCNCL
jgi:hypothetical protein